MAPPRSAEREFDRQRKLAAAVFVGAVILMLIVSAVIVYFVMQERPETMDPARPAQSGSPAAGGDERR